MFFIRHDFVLMITVVIAYTHYFYPIGTLLLPSAGGVGRLGIRCRGRHTYSESGRVRKNVRRLDAVEITKFEIHKRNAWKTSISYAGRCARFERFPIFWTWTFKTFPTKTGNRERTYTSARKTRIPRTRLFSNNHNGATDINKITRQAN